MKNADETLAVQVVARRKSRSIEKSSVRVEYSRIWYKFLELKQNPSVLKADW
jgi:hypothetical protein